MELVKVFCEEHPEVELTVTEQDGKMVVEPCWKCLEIADSDGYNLGYDEGYEAGTYSEDDDGDMR